MHIEVTHGEQEKRESKISQKVKQPLTDRMLKYALMENTNIVNETEDDQAFSSITKHQNETEPIDGGLNPNPHRKKSNLN